MCCRVYLIRCKLPFQRVLPKSYLIVDHLVETEQKEVAGPTPAPERLHSRRPNLISRRLSTKHPFHTSTTSSSTSAQRSHDVSIIIPNQAAAASQPCHQRKIPSDNLAWRISSAKRSHFMTYRNEDHHQITSLGQACRAC